MTGGQLHQALSYNITPWLSHFKYYSQVFLKLFPEIPKDDPGHISRNDTGLPHTLCLPQSTVMYIHQLSSPLFLSLLRRWGAYAGVSGDVNEYVVDYIIYVSAAVVFAGLAGLFVTTLAPYAAGSGIPEV